MPLNRSQNWRKKMFLMIDNYDSFTYNLYALFRDCGIEMKIIKNDEFIPADEYEGIILSPGPSTPEHSGTTLRYLKEYTGKKPIFAVCLGMQCIAYTLGYKIKKAKTIKHGKIDTISVIKDSVLFNNLPKQFDVVRYHSLTAEIDNDELITSVSADDNMIMSIEDRDKQFFGLQFHPESIMSQYGKEIVLNFLKFINKSEENMENLVKKINSGEKLNFEESKDFFNYMAAGDLTEAQIGAALVTMRLRGETVDELAGLVTVLNKHKKTFNHDAENCIDTCGTGGDGKSTVNVSSAVSLILASMGYNIVKHGNTAQSGKVGAADILQLMGIDIRNEKVPAEEFFKKNNFIFLFARLFHPALKGIGKVRREIKTPTIFNYVGPLANPANPDYQIIGLSKREILDFYTEAILKIGKNNITVYSSYDGYDEVSSKDKTECINIKDGKTERFIIDPVDFFEPFDMPVVKNEDQAINLFMGGISGENEDIVNLFSLNTALVLKTVNGTDLKEGFNRVREHIKGGEVKKKLEDMAN